MKNVHVTSIILLIAFGTACGGSSGGSIAGLISATDVGGNWAITNSGPNNSFNNTLNVFLVYGNCDATGPDGGLVSDRKRWRNCHFCTGGNLFHR